MTTAHDDQQIHTHEQERDHRAAHPVPARLLKHADAAARWMRDNPKAMKMLEDYAMHAWASGAQIGIALLVERVRWVHVVERRDEEGYKINNNHRAYIARELMRRRPQLRDTFETRRAGVEWAACSLLPKPVHKEDIK